MGTHGKDITVSAPASQEPSRAGTPAAQGSAVSNQQASDQPAALKPAKKTNTTSVTIDASFMAPADDIYRLLTDEARIPQWSRNSAIVSFSLTTPQDVPIIVSCSLTLQPGLPTHSLVEMSKVHIPQYRHQQSLCRPGHCKTQIGRRVRLQIIRIKKQTDCGPKVILQL
jgi:hypothetical protein